MTPAEVWLLVDAHTPPKRFGNLNEDEVAGLAELYEKLESD